jgi:hypothetical protein
LESGRRRKVAGRVGAKSRRTAPVFIPFTLIALAAGVAGWTTVVRRSARPGAVLRVLIPVVLVLSMIPDLLLLATKFIPM